MAPRSPAGQRQRISLARALVRRPRLLVLDDATSAVDPEVEARILAALRSGADGADRPSLLVVAYRKATIGLADEVVHLEGGRVVDRGTHEELPGTQPLVRRPRQRLRGRRRPRRRRRHQCAHHHRGRAVMSAVRAASSSGTALDTGEEMRAIETIRRGLHHSPELTVGIRTTLAYAVLASAGQVVVPIAVQQTLDRGLGAEGGPDLAFTAWMGVLAALAIVLTSWASYKMTSRLFRTAEGGLATLRTKAFRHVHDLPLLTQNTERRGALVARVTSDVDQVSQFLVFGGLLFVVSIGQVVIATAVMLVYSWQLTLVVWLCFAPLFASLKYFQRKLSQAYGTVRRQVGAMLSAISEPVVGAAVVRSYAVQSRTQARIDAAVDAHRVASTRAQGFTAFSFSLGGVSAGLANAGVIVVGVLLGLAGDITAGEILAFAFLVTLFVGPVQMGTQILTDAQLAIAGWRRVIGILDTPADLVDPGPAGHDLPAGPIDVRFEDVTFAYPGGPPVLRDVAMSIAAGRRVAIVGETGSGKSTFAKLLTRLMDPSRGRRAARRGRRARHRPGHAAPQRRARAAGGLPLRRHDHRQRALRPPRGDRGRHLGERRGAGPG